MMQHFAFSLIGVDFSQFGVVFFFSASCMMPPAVYSMFFLPELLRLCAQLCCSASHHLKVLPSINTHHSRLFSSFFLLLCGSKLPVSFGTRKAKFPTLGPSYFLHSAY